MAKTTFYKLNAQASMFYDAKTKLKITKGVPGKLTVAKTKEIVNATRGGHIIEIAETEYNEMLNALPEATQKAIKAENMKTTPKVDKDADEEVEQKSDDRKALEARLDKLNLSEKDKKKKLKLSDEDLESFLIDNE